LSNDAVATLPLPCSNDLLIAGKFGELTRQNPQAAAKQSKKAPAKWPGLAKLCTSAHISIRTN